MITHELVIQTAGSTGAVRAGLLRTATSAKFDHMVAAVAYATTKGVDELVKLLQARVAEWEAIRKEWLISIDEGITEPEALEALARLPNSHVWIPNGEEVLSLRLRARIRFHMKIYAFEYERIGLPLAVFSGSANLTVSGLFLNDEQASVTILIPPLQDGDETLSKEVQIKRQSLDLIKARSTRLDDGLLAQYRALRRQQPREVEDDNETVRRITVPRPVVPLEHAAEMANANSFWIEAGPTWSNRGEGNPGNQIDFPRGARVFFGFEAGEVDLNTLLGSIRIVYRGQQVERNMRYSRNFMDRLNLPLPGNPGPPTYKDQTLLFRRNADGSFTLTLGSSEEIETWKRVSEQQGTKYEMRGRMRRGRQFGFFG